MRSHVRQDRERRATSYETATEMLLAPEESARVVKDDVQAMYRQGATRVQVVRYLTDVEGGADMTLADSLAPRPAAE